MFEKHHLSNLNCDKDTWELIVSTGRLLRFSVEAITSELDFLYLVHLIQSSEGDLSRIDFYHDS